MRDTALGCKDNNAAYVKRNPPRWLSVNFAIESAERQYTPVVTVTWRKKALTTNLYVA